jgi:hypothetical protein
MRRHVKSSWLAEGPISPDEVLKSMKEFHGDFDKGLNQHYDAHEFYV